MKKHYVFLLLVLAGSLSGLASMAQNAPMIPNQNAQRNIKLVSDFVKAITVTGEQDKARLLLSPSYVAHGSSWADSATIEQTMKNWQMAYKNQMNRKNEFSAHSFRILSGAMKGDWVGLWGTYSYTDVRTGKAISFPYQYTAKVVENKIVSDRTYFDQLPILTEVGFKILPPGEARK
ncbi:nuclear transport factor 2 family protein [Spirosoma validum]|uniref:Nuclear transport factor 2 family protein n=1 Tax=Spirosoma validum TaxID=2771355 RepID=A0A927B8K0_9BACT|nr:nuclear transport factor 2 family protein [Spirosoma validum]MBD2757714.1 nuclear transport factor 2 family protein [Spirosoma validum]